jgi:hypothetical protein
MERFIGILSFLFVSYLILALAFGLALGFLQIPFWITHVLVVTAGGVAGALSLAALVRRRHHGNADDRERR